MVCLLVYCIRYTTDKVTWRLYKLKISNMEDTEPHVPCDLIIKISKDAESRMYSVDKEDGTNKTKLRIGIISVDDILKEYVVVNTKHLYDDTWLVRLSDDSDINHLKERLTMNPDVENVDFNYISFTK